jgi:streptogramin lyase
MRPRYVSALVVALLSGAILAGAYVLVSVNGAGSTSSSTDCANLTSVDRFNLNRTSFGSVTSFALPDPLRSPNSITAAPDGSVWFGEVAVPGLAHLFLNGTLVEYPWPFPNSTPGYLCFDRSEIWGVQIWNGEVWASDPANNQLVGMGQAGGALSELHLAQGVLPRFLAVDPENNLWFTETSLPAQIGEVRGANSQPLYYSVPAAQGEYTASILFENSTLAYVTAVNPNDNHGQVFSFDPLAASPAFQQVGGNQTLFGPYSTAVAQGGLWVGEHQASGLAFLDAASGAWSFYPTSTDPKLPLTLPYYLLTNGSALWFNEHDANRVAELVNRTSLTEYAMSPVPIDRVGIGNALTIAMDRNLVWFTAWTDNRVGYVNGSVAPSFSVSSPANGTATPIERGSSATIPLVLTGVHAGPLNVTFSDSESISSFPQQISFLPNASSLPSLSGRATVGVTVRVGEGTPAGSYLLLMTATDGLTSRSVYIPITVT